MAEIDQCLLFFHDLLESYISSKSLHDGSNVVALGNVSLANTENDTSLQDTIILSLVNIEEDRISRSPDNFIRQGTQVVYKNPPIYLNLYLLFSANYKDYQTGLEAISYVVKFFQYQNVFTPLTTPSNQFPPNVDELIVDLYTLSFQDLNNLWGVLGQKYLPSVLYKLRLLIMTEDFQQAGGGIINEIVVNDKTWNPS